MNLNYHFLLQNRIHNSLDIFLNGYSLNKVSKLGYPLIDINENPFIELLGILDKLEGFEQSKKIIKKSQKIIFKKEYAEILATLYKEFYNSLPKTDLSTKKINKINTFSSWNLKINDNEIKETMLTIKDICCDMEIVGFYLHGSLSTLDYVKDWSDADTLMVIKKEVVKDRERILELRKSTIKIVKNLFKIDQHHLHGCFVIPEEEMQFFPETFFPLEILKYSTCIYGSSNLIFKVRNDQEERRNLFKGFLKYFEDAISIKPRNVMEWKKFYHMLLMLPTIYFQTKGQHMYKKFSFNLIRKEFNQEQISPITKVTWIMNNWPNYKSPRNIFPSPFIIPAITKNKKLFKHIERLNTSLLKESFDLASLMKKKLEKERYL